jgi:hypothetical protein
MSASAENATWEPMRPGEHGRLDAAQTNALPESAFAFPRSRMEPMTDASHVRNALARFDQLTMSAIRTVTSHLPTSKRPLNTTA